jgi:hypothetical protein
MGYPCGRWLFIVQRLYQPIGRLHAVDALKHTHMTRILRGSFRPR